MKDFERVFVVDPASFQRRILSLLLKEQGFEKTIESDNLDFDKGPTDSDLVFVNHSHFRRSSLERIVVTGAVKTQHELTDCLNRGADTFLIKPFTPQGLALVFQDLKIDSTCNSKSSNMSSQPTEVLQ
ncbi:MAG: hypothetical protein JKX97_03790 [Candidatus Lindowbacteria bacterium]|nr:hypothetical protein [Candidatus Lindowbacteria bacterium]